MTKKIFIITILTLIFNNCMTTKDANSQTGSKKIVSVMLEYNDVANQNKVFDVDSIHWELILNVIATAKYDEEQYDEIRNPNGRMLKMPANDFTLTVKYDDKSVDKIQIWESGRIAMSGYWYFVDAKYFAAFYQMLNSYISK